jgi:peptide/nickel transport system substrate-binding protein
MYRSRTLRAASAFVAAALCMCASACSGASHGASSAGSKSNFSLADLTTGTAHGQVANLTWYGDYRAPYSEDPLKTADYPEETILGNVCEPLLHTAADYSLHPGIAQSWSQPDPLHLVFALNPKATFSDGHPVTPADVVYSLMRNLDPSVASNYADSYEFVKTITATGPEQVTVAFSRPDYTFVNNMGILAGAIVEKSFAQRAGQNFGNAQTGVMCSGPYTIASFDGTNTMVLKANPDYWDATQRPLAKTVTFRFLSDPSAISNALNSGSLDGGFDLPPSVVPQLSKASDGKLYIGGPGSTTQNIDLIVSSFAGAFSDARVRQAFSMAIDRVGIAKTVFNGAADPLYAVAGPGFWDTDPAKSVYQAAYDKLVQSPDLAAATKLVQQAGATGKSVSIAYSADTPQIASIAQVLQQAGGEIGLKVNIVGLPDQQYGNLFTDPKARAGYDSFITINYLEFPDAADMYESYATSSGSQDFDGYSDPTVQKDLAAADGTQEPTQRAELVAAAQAVLAKSLPWIPIVAPRALVFENKSVTGAPLSFSYMDSAWAASVGAP